MGAHDEASSGIKDITFGSVAGMTSKLFEHPFDLVKVRLQSQPTDRALTFTGPLDCFKQTYTKEGWKGLYRGLSMPIVGAATENACLFLVYNKMQDLIRHVNPIQSGVVIGTRRELATPEKALAAAAAGAAASFILTPIELIKCKMQVQMLTREGALVSSSAAQRVMPPLLGPLGLIRATIAQHGIRGLWLGQLGTLFRETGGSSAWFTTFNIVSQTFIARHQAADASSSKVYSKKDLRSWELMFSGACAGMMYNVVLFPADSIKSAIQTESEMGGGSGKPRGFLEMGRRIWRARGFAGLYAGCGLTVARAAPSSAMIFFIYETLERQFGDYF